LGIVDVLVRALVSPKREVFIVKILRILIIALQKYLPMIL